MNRKNNITRTLLAAALASSTLPAFAATINVTPDAADVLADDASCSLREAIRNINAGSDTHVDCAATGDYGTDDTIVLPAGTYTMAIAGISESAASATGDYDIHASMIISGAGANTTVIDADGLDRVFHVTGAYTVEMSGLTLTGGKELETGAGIYNNGGNLKLTDVIITGNEAGEGGNAPVGGGAIFNTSNGTLEISNSVISNNKAIITNDKGGAGGAIVNRGSQVTIISSTITGNEAGTFGGGIYQYEGGTIEVVGSTISGNSASNGGGIANNDASGTLSLTNTTISGNTAVDAGGGLYDIGANTTITHATFANNTATNSGAAVSVNGAGAAVLFSNTLIAGECALVDGGMITSDGHNLGTDDTCFTDGGTDLMSATANLGDLADNGGSTHTHALLAGSAAIDAGNCAGGTVTTDQRGTARPQGTACDVGAYERVVKTDSGDTGGNDKSNGNTSGGGGGGALNLPLLLALGGFAAYTRRRARR